MVVKQTLHVVVHFLLIEERAPLVVGRAGSTEGQALLAIVQDLQVDEQAPLVV